MVGCASDVSKAIAPVETERFDAVLLDINFEGEMSRDPAAILQTPQIPFVLRIRYEIGKLLLDSLRGSELIRNPYKLDELEASILAAIKRTLVTLPI